MVRKNLLDRFESAAESVGNMIGVYSPLQMCEMIDELTERIDDLEDEIKNLKRQLREKPSHAAPSTRKRRKRTVEELNDLDMDD